MQPDLWSLYAMMLKSRLFEEGIAALWHQGLISGEMHLGTGEEAIVAGVVDHLKDGDAMALDHRGTAALFMRGEDPGAMVKEFLGKKEGLCGGCGGHMHLFSKAYLAASSGIVGASGPTASGFALASQYLRPHAVSVAFLGEGSINQGMMMESMNLAAVWNLPVLFVCKDDNWSITTRSDTMTGGDLKERVRGLGVDTIMVDGIDAGDVWENARTAIDHIRGGKGPVFLYARCVHLEAHFLGFQLKRMIEAPFKEMPQVALPLARAVVGPGGAGVRERLAGVRTVFSSVIAALQDPRRDKDKDPVRHTRNKLLSDLEQLQALESRVEKEISQIFTAVQDMGAT